MTEVRRSSFFVISAWAAMYKSDIFRVARLQESLFDRNGYFFSPSGHSLSAGAYRYAILN
jgi:hypothetical protein